MSENVDGILKAVSSNGSLLSNPTSIVMWNGSAFAQVNTTSLQDLRDYH